MYGTQSHMHPKLDTPVRKKKDLEEAICCNRNGTTTPSAVKSSVSKKSQSLQLDSVPRQEPASYSV